MATSEPGGPKQHTYTVARPGVDLFVKEMGEGPDIVILHGGPGAHHDYLLPRFARLADGFRLHLYDQRGGGRSRVDRPSEITWRDHVADLDALRREWGLERMALVGYSWGGLLALLYATEHPDRVGTLVLVDSAALWGDYPREFREEFERRTGSEAVRRMRTELEASDLRTQDPEAYRRRRFELSVAGYFRDPREAHDLTPFRVQAQAQQATWASLRGQERELRRRVRDLDAPTLILHGRHDPMPLGYAEELARLIPGARLIVLRDSAHVPYVEEPEILFPAIRTFLEEHPVT